MRHFCLPGSRSIEPCRDHIAFPIVFRHCDPSVAPAAAPADAPTASPPAVTAAASAAATAVLVHVLFLPHQR